MEFHPDCAPLIWALIPVKMRCWHVCLTRTAWVLNACPRKGASSNLEVLLEKMLSVLFPLFADHLKHTVVKDIPFIIL